MSTPPNPGAENPPADSSSSSLLSLLYVSAACRRFAAPELSQLLSHAREKNSLLGVTGLLLYKDGLFLQVLEGAPEPVRRLYSKIAADPRHRACSVVQESAVPRRQFAEWSMGFRNLDDPAVRRMPGYSPFMENPRLFTEVKDDPGGCWAILSLFRDEV